MVMSLVAAGCGGTPLVTRAPSALANGVTEEVLINNSFLIATDMLESDGKKNRIKFLPDGSLDCPACHANGWRIRDINTLEFVSGDRVMTTYKYNPRADALIGYTDSVFDDKIKIWIER